LILAKLQLMLLLKLQVDSNTKVKVIEVPKVSMEKIKDSPPRLQLKGMPNGAIESIIELPHDPLG